MKLAISNLAWNPAEEARIAELMRERGLHGVEIAPTKAFAKPTQVSERTLTEYRAFWQGFGIEIVAMQSLLFGQPSLRIFQDEPDRLRTRDYLARIIELGGKLGAAALVFGSPGVRAVGNMQPARAWAIAVEFFRELGELAQHQRTCLCIEPNPTEYGCDFIRTAAQGRALVNDVNSAGFRLHLDGGALTMNGEDADAEIRASIEYLMHFHASEPHLKALGDGTTDHRTLGGILRSAGYQGWVSVEMRGHDSGNNAVTVERALDIVCEAYG